MTIHSSLATLLAYRDGEDLGRRRRRTARHLLACAACRDRLGRLDRIRDTVAAIASPEPPDVLDSIQARVRSGEAVLLPRASDGPTPRRRLGARSSAVAALVLLACVGTAAAMGAFEPVVAWLGGERPAAGAPASEPARGIATAVPASGLRIELPAETGPTRLRVSVGDGELLEIFVLGASPGLRFISGEDRVRLAGGVPREVRVMVPSTAGPVELVRGDEILARVEGGRVLPPGRAPVSSFELTLPPAPAPSP